MGIQRDGQYNNLESGNLTRIATDNIRNPLPDEVGKNALWIIAGVSICSFFVFMAILIAFICARKRKKKTSTADLEESHLKYSYNQPKSTPLGTPTYSSTAKRLVRSITLHGVPSFSLPPERIQPQSPSERRRSMTAFQYQQNLLGSVQPDLYRYSEDEDIETPPSPYGRMWFSVIYDAAVEQLTVTLVKAKHLPGRGKNNAPKDPFVNVYLLPDEKTYFQCKGRKKTLRFNECFCFQVSSDEITTRTLRLSVYDLDKRRVRHSLGHVLVNMCDIDLTRNEIMWRDLEPVSQTTTSLGEIQISLTYVPNIEKMKLVILKAKNLRKLEYEDTGTYVRVQMMCGRKVVKTKKTESQKGTCEPDFNESMIFGVTPKQLETCSFVITVMMTSNHRLVAEEDYGKVVIGSFMYARGEELVHWQEAVSQPRTSINRWHQLSPPVAL